MKSPYQRQIYIKDKAWKPIEKNAYYLHKNNSEVVRIAMYHFDKLTLKEKQKVAKEYLELNK